MSIEVGAKVRVKRADYHGIKFGAVCRVISIAHWNDDVVVEGPVVSGYFRNQPDPVIDTQFIELADLLPAPQANRKS